MLAKDWLKGVHLTSINVLGGTRSGTTITWETVGSGNSLSGQVDFVRITAQNLLDMIVSVDATGAHYEPTLFDSGLSVGEILRASGNILDSKVFTNTYMKVIFTRGARTFTFEGVVDNYGDGVSAIGKNANVISLKQIMFASTGGLTVS